MKGDEAMETKPSRKSRKYAKPWTLRLFTVVLLAASMFLLYFVSLIVMVWNLTEVTVKRYERLKESVLMARVDTKELTESYDQWRYARLQAIDYIYSRDLYDPEAFCSRIGTYYDEINFCMVSREDNIVIGRTGSDPEPQKLKEVIQKSYEQNEGMQDFETARYYYHVLSDGKLAVIHMDSMDYWSFMDNIYTESEVLSSNLRDEENFFIGVNNGVIQYTDDYDLSGKPYDEVVTDRQPLNVESFDSLQLSLVSLKGKPMIEAIRPEETIDIDLYYLIPIYSLNDECFKILGPVYLVLIIFTILFEEYLHNLRLDHAEAIKGKKKVSEIRYKGLAAAALVILAVSTTAFSTYSLYGLSTFIENYKIALRNATYIIEDNSLCREDLQKDYDREALKDAHMIGRYLSDHPEHRLPEVLDKFSNIFRDSYIMMFDTDGKETVTNSEYAGYSISNDPESNSYRFHPLKYGISEVVGPLEKNELTGEEEQIIGVKTKYGTGHVDGFLLKVFYPAELGRALEHATLEGTFDNSVVSNVFDCFLIDSETKQFIVYPYDHERIGQSALNYGFREENLKGDFCGYITTNGDRYFMASTALRGSYLYVGMDVEDIFQGRGIITIMSTVITVIILLVIALMFRGISVSKKASEEKVQTDTGTQPPSDMVYVVVSNEMQNTFSPLVRLKNLRKSWSKMNAEQKLGKIISEIAVILAAVITVVLVFRDRIFGPNSVLSFILEGNWPRGINPFSISASMILFVEAFVAITILRTVLNLLAGVLSPRAKTLCHLVRSFIEYGGTIAVAYIALSFLGVDVRALSASVGFLALIVGFGAKSLITDIVAGMFIIFEKEFQVGDIVEISGYRGMVKEIGLRTTKVLSWDKNIKIINNHDISNVLNMTMRNSFATVSFTIPVTVPIQELEDIFRSELPRLCEKYPQIIGVPYFAGVLSFSGSKMKCRVSAEVKELERGELETDLHREVQEILTRHGISMK